MLAFLAVGTSTVLFCRSAQLHHGVCAVGHGTAVSRRLHGGRESLDWAVGVMSIGTWSP